MQIRQKLLTLANQILWGGKKKIQLEYLNFFVFPRVWNLGVEFDSCLKFNKLTL